MSGEPPGADSDLGAGPGRQWGGGQTTRDTTADAGTRRRVQSERRRLTGGGGWATSEWTVLSASK